MSAALRIGIDFDNTIAGYDHVFADAARDVGWLSADNSFSKRNVRDSVRLLPDGEIKWQKLQARVYGARMAEALPLPGSLEFLRRAQSAGLTMFIVSHKTQFANYDPDRVDLRDAARTWIAAQRIPIPADAVFFEPTRAEKIARIKALGCTHFIDDLEEVFIDSDFPSDVERFLLSEDIPRVPEGIHVFRSWHDIATAFFD